MLRFQNGYPEETIARLFDMTTSTADIQDPFADFPVKPGEADCFTAPTQKASLPSNVCPNCLSTMNSGQLDYCDSCGYYVRLGLVVGGEEEEIEEKEFPLTSVAAMAAAFIAVGLFNIAILFYTPQGSPERTWWSLAQLAVGSFGFIVGHMYCFFRTVSTDGSVGMMDFVVSPTVGWFNSARLLPQRQWAFVLGVAGVAAVLGSVLVLRGIPYNALFEGGPRMERKELISVIGQAVREAQQAQEGADSLEEALLAFSDEGAEPLLDFVEEPTRLYKDAVVIAYWTNSVGIVDRVLLAGALDGKLQQLGMVGHLPQGASKKLTRVLPKHARRTPFLSYASDPSKSDEEADNSSTTDGRRNGKAVATHERADTEPSTDGGESSSQASGIQWVQPKWLCRISYAETSEGIPIDIQLHWVVRKMTLR